MGALEQLDPIEKARRNPRSLRAAINGMCWSCQGGGGNPSTRWLIGNCEVETCPLWPQRPYRGKAGEDVPTAYAWAAEGADDDGDGDVTSPEAVVRWAAPGDGSGGLVEELLS